MKISGWSMTRQKERGRFSKTEKILGHSEVRNPRSENWTLRQWRGRGDARRFCFLWMMRNIRGCEIGMKDAFDQGQDDEGEEIARMRQCRGGWVHIKPIVTVRGTNCLNQCLCFAYAPPIWSQWMAIGFPTGVGSGSVSVVINSSNCFVRSPHVASKPAVWGTIPFVVLPS